MSTLPSLLAQAALEVRQRAATAALVGLDPDELEQLADRLVHGARYTPEEIVASLRMLAAVFGDREAWAAISPAFVALMDEVKSRS